MNVKLVIMQALLSPQKTDSDFGIARKSLALVCPLMSYLYTTASIELSIAHQTLLQNCEQET